LTLWLLRVAWFSLPATAGPAAAAALRDLSSPVRIVGALLLWVGWAIVLFGTLAPRPIGLTAVRVGAAAALPLALTAAGRAGVSSQAATVGLLAVAVAAIMSALPGVGAAYVNGPAYGDERRFPLRVPPVLWIGPVPLATVLLVAGVGAGPLLLAARSYVAGAIALVAGGAIAFGLARSLHTLARRWAVIVPAGLVLHDPLTLADPVLFPRDRIVKLAVVDPVTTSDATTLDIRLAALGGSLLLTLTDEAQIVRARPGRRGGVVTNATRVLFAPTRPGDLLDLALRRRIRVQ
jgi:hypothetical protein